MKKDEILTKSKQENKHGDERDKKILNDSIKISFIVLICLSILFAIIRSIQGYPVMDLPIICCAAVLANFLYRFITTKEKFNLIISIVMLVILILFIINFIIGY